MFAFEKLEVWILAMDLTVEVYKLTENFPKPEQFSLTDQVRRAIAAVPANISEGNSRQTNKDKAHFLTIAYSSLMETMNHLILASKLNYVNENDLKELRTKIEKVSAQISALRNYHLSHR